MKERESTVVNVVYVKERQKMRISRVCNMDLLKAIKEAGKITREDLEKVYLPPKQPGVGLGIRVSFDSELNDLIEEGCISYNGGKYKFLHWV
ncbi:MAG: hypothetical protein LUC25_07100 [Ruminococcus sp.]|nr:hypothetical protein [Ruminococcus sp.]